MYDEVIDLKASEILSQHWMRHATADGQMHYVLTGVLAPHLKATGADWQQRTLRASVPIQGLDSGKKFVASQWAPSISLAAIDADAATTNPGWAIDGFGLVSPNLPADHVVLDVQTAVRAASCVLLRMTYQIALVGTIT